MSSSTFSALAVATAAVTLLACGVDRRTVDVCARGDRDDLAAALDGGTLDLEVIDDHGEVIASSTIAAAAARGIDLDFSGGARVRITGRDAGGDIVAGGEADLSATGACVCLALSAQQAAACGGLSCVIDSAGSCRFIDDATGETAAIRELSIAASADTTLVAAAPDSVHAKEPVLGAEVDGEVALMAFDLSPLPHTAIVDGARLEFQTAPPPAVAPDRFAIIAPILEPWDPATATWRERAPDTPWQSAGCGPGSCAEDPWGRASIELSGVTVAVPLGLHLQDWVSGAEPNFGLAVHADGNRATLLSADGSAGPRLVVAFHLPEDDLPDPEPGPICGNGLREDGEACDDGDDRDDDGCTGCALARCGDGVVRTGVEQCEQNDPGCTKRCLLCADPNATATWASPDGRCYALYTAPVRRTYRNAENACDDHGHATLAVFETKAEHTAVLAGLGAIADPVWIGLTDRGTEGTFRWVTGDPLGWDAFATGEPTAEDCVSLEQKRWHARSCTLVRGFICESAPWIDGTGGRAYKVIVGRTDDWRSAELACQGTGAHLAAVHAGPENTVLANAAGFEVWLGLSETETEGTLEWVTGERLGFDHFDTPPDLDGETYCGLLEESGDGWDVEACSRARRYVCEAE